MNEYVNEMTALLSDVGCQTDAVDKAKTLLEAGYIADLIRYLRRLRCGFMDQMHESQKRIDRLDYLIHQTEKQQM